MLGRRVSETGLTAQLRAIAADEGGPMSRGVPERWLESPTWRCPAAHVSTRRADGRRPRCRFCGSVVVPTFPEDRSGPLAVKNEWLEATRAGRSVTVPHQSRHTADSPEGVDSRERIRDGFRASRLTFTSDGPATEDDDSSPTVSARTGLRRPR